MLHVAVDHGAVDLIRHQEFELCMILLQAQQKITNIAKHCSIDVQLIKKSFWEHLLGLILGLEDFFDWPMVPGHASRHPLPMGYVL